MFHCKYLVDSLLKLESRLDELTESVLVARLADRVQNKKNKCKAVY